jgi:phosphate transport system substrate-binding protein
MVIVLLCAVLIGVSLGADAQFIKYDGTPTCFSTVKAISEEYTKAHPDITFDIRPSGAFGALERLSKDDLDIACIEFPLRKRVDKAWVQAFPRGKAPAARLTFAFTALGVAVNDKNSLAKLTKQQLRDIFSGKATSWRQIGGAGGRIKVFTSGLLSGSMVSDMILDAKEWPIEVTRAADDRRVIASVTAEPDAIGFVVVDPNWEEQVKLVPIAVNAGSPAVQASPENIVREKYCMVREFQMILSDKSSPAAHDFAKFACSDAVEKIVMEHGYYPVVLQGKIESEKPPAK